MHLQQSLQNIKNEFVPDSTDFLFEGISVPAHPSVRKKRTEAVTKDRALDIKKETIRV